MAKKAEWLASISPEGAASLLEGAREMRGGADEIQEGKREFQEGMAAAAAAQAGLARSTAALADVYYQQLRFGDARDMAGRTLVELDQPDAASHARLLIARRPRQPRRERTNFRDGGRY